MTWNTIKLRPEDKIFSTYIRKRDGKCVYCGSSYNLQCSHYHGRRKESVRFDPENCDTLCAKCHKLLENEKGWTSGIVDGKSVNLPRFYTAFKIKQLGQQRFDALTARATKSEKKDKVMTMLKVKGLLETLKAA